MPFFSAWIREKKSTDVCVCLHVYTLEWQNSICFEFIFTSTRARIHRSRTYESINVMSSVNDHLFYISLLTQKCRKVKKARTPHHKVVHSHIHSFVRLFVRFYTYAWTKQVSVNVFSTHKFIYSWAYTQHTSFAIFEIRIVFIQFADTHFTICCMQKWHDKEENKRNEMSKKNPSTKYTSVWLNLWREINERRSEQVCADERERERAQCACLALRLVK